MGRCTAALAAMIGAANVEVISGAEDADVGVNMMWEEPRMRYWTAWTCHGCLFDRDPLAQS
jgi:hypothetical protein